MHKRTNRAEYYLNTLLANSWDSDQTPRLPNCVSFSLTDEKEICI